MTDHLAERRRKYGWWMLFAVARLLGTTDVDET